MISSLSTIKKQFEEDLENASTLAEVDLLKIKFFGKKGTIQDLMRALKEVDPADRPTLGKEINLLKEEMINRLESKQQKLEALEINQRLLNEKIDVTLPGSRGYLGGKHIITQFTDKMLSILTHMGFTVQYGPYIDSDFYNFEALNMSPDHPARDMQDTFYITPNVLLRTHTSNVQVRVMESQKPPIRVVSPGKTFRNEDVSARSHVFFHQLEAFYIDRNVDFSDLLGTMEQFLKLLFNENVKMRVRPSYFPFVEPGMEVDIHCIACQGKGCNLCKQSGWLEIAGAGMIHPEVLKLGGIDPEEYSGFAWGMGIERAVMLKHDIKDIRLFTENDLRFLKQFV